MVDKYFLNYTICHYNHGKKNLINHIQNYYAHLKRVKKTAKKLIKQIVSLQPIKSDIIL